MSESEPLLPAVNPRRQHPFGDEAARERPSRDGQIGVRVAAGVISSVTQVSTWISGIDALCSALAPALGVAALPERTGDIVGRAEGDWLLRSGPEEFLLVSDTGSGLTTRLRQSITASIGSVTDLSHARCCLRMEGPHTRDTLSKLFAIDLREAQFPVGRACLTGHHHVSCVLRRHGKDDFEMLVFTTYARDQLETVVDAAREYGVSVRVG